MATVTRNLAYFGESVVIFEIDYNDVSLLLLAVRCINNSAEPAYGKAYHLATGRMYDSYFPANQTTFLPIPTGPQTRMQVSVDARGRVDGVDYTLVWPA